MATSSQTPFNWKRMLGLRFLHRNIAILTALPLLIIITSGALLSISPKIEWLQPKGPALEAGVKLSFEQILAIAKTVPEAQIASWEDVAQVDARPSSGVIRVRAQNYWEVQINANTGEIVKKAPRWKTLLVIIHEGTWFAPWMKTWIFFPTGLLALILWFTGILLWVKPKLRKKQSS